MISKKLTSLVKVKDTNINTTKQKIDNIGKGLGILYLLYNFCKYNLEPNIVIEIIYIKPK